VLAPVPAVRDFTVAVSASSTGLAGIVFDHVDSGTFMAAVYNPHYDAIYLRRRSGGTWGRLLGRVRVPEIGPEIRLQARVEGSRASLRVSDTTRAYSTACDLDDRSTPGRIGLIGNDPVTGNEQGFDDYAVSNLDGDLLFEDVFDDGDALGRWELVTDLVEAERAAPPRDIAPTLDALAWHQDGSTPARSDETLNKVRLFRKACESLGFSGHYVVNELYTRAPYPPGRPSELEKAKCMAQHQVLLASLGILSLQCNTYHVSVTRTDASLLRNTFSFEPVSPAQPQAAYYVLRNLITAMDEAKPLELEVAHSCAPGSLTVATFRQGENGVLVGLWLEGIATEGVTERPCDIHLATVDATSGWVIDILNGTEQALVMDDDGPGTRIPGVLVKDYPVLLRLVGGLPPGD